MIYQKKTFLIIIILIVIIAVIGSLTILKYRKGNQESFSKFSEIKKEQIETKERKKGEKKEFCKVPANRGPHLIKGDSVFCDNKGRMWSETATSGFNWDEAVSYCENLTYAGFSDWVLPGVEEGESFRESFVLYQLAQENCGWTGKRENQEKCVPSWDKNANKSSAKYPYGYWTNLELGNKKAWRIDFYNGNVRPTTKDHIFSVRCVREGE